MVVQCVDEYLLVRFQEWNQANCSKTVCFKYTCAYMYVTFPTRKKNRCPCVPSHPSTKKTPLDRKWLRNLLTMDSCSEPCLLQVNKMCKTLSGSRVSLKGFNSTPDWGLVRSRGFRFLLFWLTAGRSSVDDTCPCSVVRFGSKLLYKVKWNSYTWHQDSRHITAVPMNLNPRCQSIPHVCCVTVVTFP